VDCIQLFVFRIRAVCDSDVNEYLVVHAVLIMWVFMCYNNVMVSLRGPYTCLLFRKFNAYDNWGLFSFVYLISYLYL
jgi:hypothetical protein